VSFGTVVELDIGQLPKPEQLPFDFAPGDPERSSDE